MDVNLSASGPPETILPDPHPRLLSALEKAGSDPLALRAVAAAHPTSSEAWAALGAAVESAEVPGAVEAYAYYRVGYHRGLDLLRRSGWKGSGYVRREHRANRGFLECLEGLGRMAAVIGETDEVERIGEFLEMLDPGRGRRRIRHPD